MQQTARSREKSIGARGRDIVGCTVTVLIRMLPCWWRYCWARSAQVFVNIFAGLLNFDALGGSIPPQVLP
jgi:hypothetical protein